MRLWLDDINQMRREGRPWKVIGRLFNVNPHTLRRHVYRLGGGGKIFLKNREAEIMPMRARRMSWEQIADATGYSVHSLKMTASKYGWNKRAREAKHEAQ